MSVRGAHKTISEVVTTWPGVSQRPHRFGAVAFFLGERREIGHVHGDHVVDIPFPIQVRDELIAAGRAERHAFVPDSGAVSVRLRKPEDVTRAVELLRLSFEMAVKQRGRGRNSSPLRGSE